MVLNIAGIITGIATIIFGISRYSDSFYYNYLTTNKYGADAYTDIQNANAITANCMQNISRQVNEWWGALFIVLGVLIIIYFLKRIIIENKKER